MITPDLQKKFNKMLEEISTTELLTGLLLFGDNRWFTDQMLYQWLSEIGSNFVRRFRIHQSSTGFHSDPLARIFDFLTMGHILEEKVYAPGPENYFRRRGDGSNLREELGERNVLPRHEEVLRELAENFWQGVKTYLQLTEADRAALHRDYPDSSTEVNREHAQIFKDLYR